MVGSAHMTKMEEMAKEPPTLYQSTTVREYRGRFESFASHMEGLSEQFLIFVFARGLREELRLEVERFKPRSLSAAIGLALLREDRINREAGKASNFSLVPPIPPLTELRHEAEEPKYEPEAMSVVEEFVISEKLEVLESVGVTSVEFELEMDRGVEPSEAEGSTLDHLVGSEMEGMIIAKGMGQSIEASVAVSGASMGREFGSEVTILNSWIHMCIGCDHLSEARQVFDEMPRCVTSEKSRPWRPGERVHPLNVVKVERSSSLFCNSVNNSGDGYSASPFASNFLKCRGDIVKALKVDVPVRAHMKVTSGGVWDGGGREGQENLFVASLIFDTVAEDAPVDPKLTVSKLKLAEFQDTARHFVYQYTLLVIGVALEQWQETALLMERDEKVVALQVDGLNCSYNESNPRLKSSTSQCLCRSDQVFLNHLNEPPIQEFKSPLQKLLVTHIEWESVQGTPEFEESDNETVINIIFSYAHKSQYREWTIGELTRSKNGGRDMEVSFRLNLMDSNRIRKGGCREFSPRRVVEARSRIRWTEVAHDGLEIIASILLVVFVTATRDCHQSLQFKDSDKEKKISVQVTRNGFGHKLSIYDLLLGDIVHLVVGDQIPADGLLLPGFSLLINESSLIEESEPDIVSTDNPFLVSGTKVQEGSCTMLVTTIGRKTLWGNLMATLREGGDDETPLRVNLNGVVTFIGKIGLFFAIVTIVVLAQGLIVHNYQEVIYLRWSGDDALEILEYFAIAITIVIVTVPEGLPLAVTLSLAFAMKKMMNDKALVRHLEACETRGLATTICSDKTGTMTTNHMTVVKAGVCGNIIKVNNPMKDINIRSQIPDAKVKTLLQSIFNNTGGEIVMNQDGKLKILETPTDTTLLEFGLSLDGDFQKEREETKLIVAGFTCRGATDC